VTTVEDRTRAAMDAITGLVGGVPPLPLPPPPGAASRGLAPARRRRWAAWLAPAAAAAAVLAVAVSLVVVKDIPNGRVVPPTPPPAHAQEGVPRYYVTLYSPVRKSGAGLLVGDTLTGARVAVVPPPRGMRFAGIAAAADDRTFVVAAAPPAAASTDAEFAQHRTWYLLRIAPGTSSHVQLTHLAIPPLNDIYAIALSGSGRELAVAVEQIKLEELLVYSVSSGKLLHRWSTTETAAHNAKDEPFGPTYAQDESRALAWIDGDHALAFTASFFAKQSNGQWPLEITWRRLDVATGGGDLVADSKVIWSVSPPAVAHVYSPGCHFDFGEATELISGDGETVVCASANIVQGSDNHPMNQPVVWRVAWLAFSVRTGAVRTLAQVKVRTAGMPYIYGLWASTSGNTIIGEWGLTDNNGNDLNPHVGVIRHGTFKQLPTPPDAGPLGPSVTW